jgi:NTE family protein
MPQSRIAFVLSGGGSLGAIQVGMLQALLEEGIKPDLLVGTSAGAVNAAWIAGLPHRDGVRDLAGIWCGLRRQDIFPLSPWAGARGLIGRTNHVISNTGLRALLERHIPYQRLEDAKVPVRVVATDLKTGHAVILSSGPSVPALLASTAIPGVFPPVRIGRRELVDGGVADMTPIAAAIQEGATQVYVLPIGYSWLRQERSNAIGMAMQALARVVEQRLRRSGRLPALGGHPPPPDHRRPRCVAGGFQPHTRADQPWLPRDQALPVEAARGSAGSGAGQTRPRAWRAQRPGRVTNPTDSARLAPTGPYRTPEFRPFGARRAVPGSTATQGPRMATEYKQPVARCLDEAFDPQGLNASPT